MRLLLDTHVLLWWLRDSPRLRTRPRAVIAEAQNQALVSVASLWEISIKHRIGKMEGLGTNTWREAIAQKFHILPVKREHLLALESLPLVRGHKDPFDHLILAQAKAEDAVVMTGDRVMAQYGVRCLGVG